MTAPAVDRACERCGKKHLGAFVWLELNNVTGRYCTPGTVPPAESQGLFPFGKTCAYRALGLRSAWTPLRRAAHVARMKRHRKAKEEGRP